jgi:type IV secretory pathway VirB4 component
MATPTSAPAGAGSSSTQSHIKIAEIKDNTVVLKDGSIKAVLVVSSTNFALKSAEEQTALIAAYQSFLNSVDYPIQILMQSRKLDIGAYLEKLKGIVQQQSNELLRLQTQEYIEYVAKLVEFASIMNKTFYVVITHGTAVTQKGFMHKFTNMFNPAGTVTMEKQEFEHNKELLFQRVDRIASALNGMGLKSILLTTEELIELMYNSYNLDAASTIHIRKIEDLELTRGEE